MPDLVEVLYFEGCPHAEPAIALVREVLASLAPDTTLELRRIDSEQEAKEVGFLGSPSVRVDGHDIERRDEVKTELTVLNSGGTAVYGRTGDSILYFRHNITV